MEYGTKKHPIGLMEEGGGTATRGKALRFKGKGGKWVFRRSVMHPGTKPYKFGWKSAHAAHRILGQRLERGMTAAAQKF